MTEDATWSKKLKGYLASEWNIIDVIYLSMIFTAFGLSAIGSMREVSRILYGMVTLLLWLRVIRLYQVRDEYQEARAPFYACDQMSKRYQTGIWTFFGLSTSLTESFGVWS